MRIFSYAATAVGTVVSGGITTVVVPLVGEIWTHFLHKGASEAEMRAAAANQNAAILRQLIDSLGELLNAIELVANFICTLGEELRGIADVKTGESLKRAHFLKMRGKCSTVVESCKAFIAVEPAITSDLRSIEEKLDEDYINKWNQGLKDFSENLTLELSRD